MDKKELRRYIREQKRHFTPQQLGEMSLDIMSSLLSHSQIQKADSVLMYHSLPDEVDTHSALDKLLAMGKKVLLPKVVSDTEMTIHEYTGKESLQPSEPYGILEPTTPELSIINCQLSIAVVPGMAFDRQGHRLGRGKGYYDRFLSQIPNIYKIGVCFPFQMLESIPSESTDVVMDEVITSLNL
jgi:5-formyltetrahydrofolate cyclo-ligase